MTERALWDAYAAGDDRAREQLLAQHLNLVHHIARRIQRRLAAPVELDELVSAGTMGLLDALARFDHRRGLAFSTFAVPRVRGAILDELRRLDHLPPAVRRRARALGATRAGLANHLGRAPRSHETAMHLGVDVETLWRWQTEAQSAVQVGLDHTVGTHTEGGVPLDEVLKSDDHTEIEERLTLAQEIDVLREAILRLTQQERTVLTLYYFEELKLHEIAQVLDVTESRISQIRMRAIARLREELEPLRALVA